MRLTVTVLSVGFFFFLLFLANKTQADGVCLIIFGRLIDGVVDGRKASTPVVPLEVERKVTTARAHEPNSENSRRVRLRLSL